MESWNGYLCVFCVSPGGLNYVSVKKKNNNTEQVVSTILAKYYIKDLTFSLKKVCQKYQRNFSSIKTKLLKIVTN